MKIKYDILTILGQSCLEEKMQRFVLGTVYLACTIHSRNKIQKSYLNQSQHYDRQNPFKF